MRNGEWGLGNGTGDALSGGGEWGMGNGEWGMGEITIIKNRGCKNHNSKLSSPPLPTPYSPLPTPY